MHSIFFMCRCSQVHSLPAMSLLQLNLSPTDSKSVPQPVMDKLPMKETPLLFQLTPLYLCLNKVTWSDQFSITTDTLSII